MNFKFQGKNLGIDSNSNELSGWYEDFLENLRAGAERFRAEYSETMREYVTEQKTYWKR